MRVSVSKINLSPKREVKILLSALCLSKQTFCKYLNFRIYYLAIQTSNDHKVQMKIVSQWKLLGNELTRLHMMGNIGNKWISRLTPGVQEKVMLT